jgi:hypothetical protein
MILYRTGQSFRIATIGANEPALLTEFTRKRPADVTDLDVTDRAHHLVTDYRRWWANSQPEERRAKAEVGSAYVVDVSNFDWTEGSYLLTFCEHADAQRFALLFLGLDQAECEALVERMKAPKHFAEPRS